MKNISKKLALPYIIAKRPEWDKFAGAYYSIGIDSLMPNGRAIQIAGIHQYKNNFSIPFGIKFRDMNGNTKYVHQTTYGMSERLIGAIVGIHGDEFGIKLPPAIAPYQVVIVPIYKKDMNETIIMKCKEIYDILRNAGIRTELDLRSLRPGEKFYYWDAKGVPIRLEIGMRETAKNSACLIRRDKKGIRIEVLFNELITKTKEILNEIEKDMFTDAKILLENSIYYADKDTLYEHKKPILRVNWCGNEKCGLELENITNMKMLGIALDDYGNPLNLLCSNKFTCAICDCTAIHSAYLAKTY
jgi:prolyl-tRNA synthetase